MLSTSKKMLINMGSQNKDHKKAPKYSPEFQNESTLYQLWPNVLYLMILVVLKVS